MSGGSSTTGTGPRARTAARERPLGALTEGLVEAPDDVRVSDVTLDSRAVSAGALFLACRGGAHHGLEFAEQAIERGARAILYEVDPAGMEADAEAGSHARSDASADRLPPRVHAAAEAGRVFIAAVPRLAQEAGAIADRFFETPSRFLTVAGVTGTNGKTTCAYLAAQALSKLGRTAGYLGTLGCGLPGSITPLDLTTPDAVTVQRRLAELRALGAECVMMEVSSHALEQGRVNGVRFRAAAFTNLTRDHLDYHGSMEAYGAAKARLFERDVAARIVNVDDGYGRELAQRFAAAAGRLIVTSRQPLERVRADWPDADALCARDIAPGAAGSTFAIDSSAGIAQLTTPLIGEFNVDNVLTALGLLLSLDAPLDRAIAALASCTAPPGRMELVRGEPDGAAAIIDYAHTPDALAKALRAARAHCAGALRVVFGCGGDRDRGKRALMGRTAYALADEVIVTDDNPRTEDPGRIVADIMEGIESPEETPGARAGARERRAGASVRVQHDREAAIREALAASSAGDVVLIAGKGHEAYQIVGRERRPFSDRAVARAYLSASKGRA